MNIKVSANLTNYKGRKYTEEQIKRALVDLLDEKSTEVLAKIRMLMRAPKTGKWYRTSSGSPYQASAPGEAPAVRDGKLINSLRRRKSNEGLTIKITAEVKHGKWMEYGTTKIAKRPFMAPAMVGVRNLTAADGRNAINRAVKARNL